MTEQNGWLSIVDNRLSPDYDLGDISFSGAAYSVSDQSLVIYPDSDSSERVTDSQWAELRTSSPV